MKTLQSKSQDIMALVKLRRSGQITLTAELRKQFNLAEGDYLEAEAVREGILLMPVSIMGREQAWNQIEAAIDTVDSGKCRIPPSALVVLRSVKLGSPVWYAPAPIPPA